MGGYKLNTLNTDNFFEQFAVTDSEKIGKKLEEK